LYTDCKLLYPKNLHKKGCDEYSCTYEYLCHKCRWSQYDKTHKLKISITIGELKSLTSLALQKCPNNIMYISTDDQHYTKHEDLLNCIKYD
jgi:hypothetical protein